MRLKHFAPLFCALACALGCSADEDRNVIVPVPLSECPDHDYSACDTRSAACQARMLSLAACVYGAAKAPAVPVDVVSQQEFREALESGQWESRDERSDDEIAANELLDRALAELGYIEAGALSDEATIDSIVESFVGVYVDTEIGVVLVDYGVPQNDPDADSTLAHEFVHALQDADYALNDWVQAYAGTTDSLLAARAVSEGQATYYGLRIGFAMYGYREASTDWEGVFSNLRQDLDSSARKNPSPYVASASTFPYSYGGTLAYRAWLDGGQGFEAQLFDAPPRSTQEVARLLFPDDVTAVVDVELAAPSATGDYVVIGEDSLGAWLLQTLLRKRDFSVTSTNALAGAWTADHLWLYRDADDRRAWLWELQLMPGNEDEFAALADSFAEGLSADTVLEQSDGRLFIAGGSDGVPAELLDAGRTFLTLESGE